MFTIKDLPAEISTNLEQRVKIPLTKQESHSVLKEILDVQKIGFRTPQQDFDHIKDFSRVTNQLQQQKEFELQDSMIDKLRHFLLYLVMVKFEATWKPNVYRKDIVQMLNKNHKWSSAEWMHTMFKQSARVYEQRCEGNRTDDTFQELQDKTRLSNPSLSLFPEYSIWDRVCTEEILALREKLEESIALTEKDARQKSLTETLEIVRETLHKPNKVFDEVLKEDLYREKNIKLTRSKMELLLEAQKFATLVSNLDEDEAVFDTGAKVNTSLILADLTLDVNHVLGAMIYLAQSFQ